MIHDIHNHRVLILDFGSQYTQLIARRIREIGVFCEIYPYDVKDQEIKKFNPKAIVLSGGPETVTTDNSPKCPAVIFEMNIPVLGICYGMQTMVSQLGGKVFNAPVHEFGHASIALKNDCDLLTNIEDHIENNGNLTIDVWMSHGDRVEEIPQGFKVTASTASCPIAAIANENKKFYGLQFHPEVTHTKQGLRIIERFITDIAKCEKLWNPDSIVESLINEMRSKIGKRKVLLGLSGGVDSSVVAALLHKAVGDQLICVFVDNGLLRENESKQVMTMFKEHMGVKIIQVDAENEFLEKLVGATEPENKRKIIGETFIEIFESQAAELNNIELLAQGTIYPDVIESAASKTGKAHVIKSHHNVGGLPDFMKMKLVEPLRELFKDEVRKVGMALGLPYDMVYRHPFPGPGLAVRILGEVKKEYTAILRRADKIFIEELRSANLYDKVSQAFVVFLPVKSVGVTGDARRYSYVVSLRAVETVDFMTAHWAELPYKFLAHVSNRIINEISDIARVTYDISGKPPSTIEWE